MRTGGKVYSISKNVMLACLILNIWVNLVNATQMERGKEFLGTWILYRTNIPDNMLDINLSGLITIGRNNAGFFMERMDGLQHHLIWKDGKLLDGHCSFEVSYNRKTDRIAVTTSTSTLMFTIYYSRCNT